MMQKPVEGASLCELVQPALLVHPMGSKQLPCWTPSLQFASGRGHASILPVGIHHAAICDATCEMMRLLVWQATAKAHCIKLCCTL